MATRGGFRRGRPEVIRREELPETLRAVPHLRQFDYFDLFTVVTDHSAARSAEEWARAVIETASSVGGFFVWRVLLGLDLAPRGAPGHIAGWRIARRGDAWLGLEASSWFVSAQLVVQVDPGSVSLGTFITYDRKVAAWIWAPIARAHRQAVPDLLRHAVRRIG